MSEAQPRRRKEKRRKKDDSDEGPSTPPTKAHTPQPASTQGEGDSVIHVHHEGGTGGHWCAKIIFFVLLGVLVALVGLIIIENRGLTDLDTPVAESRFAQVFDGWVDEGPIHDDHHDEHTLELKHPDDDHDDEHDDEEDADEHDDEIEDIESDVPDDDHDDDDEGEDAEVVDSHEDNDNELDDNIEISQENNDDNDEDEDEVDDDDNNNDEQNDEDEQDEDNMNSQEEDEENFSVEINDVETQYSEENYNGGEDDEDEYLNISPRDDDDDNNASNERYAENQESTEDILNFSNEDDIGDDAKDLPFEEVDSFEEDVVDNTAGEEEQLAAKKAEKLAQEQEENSGMGMRVAVGLALILVTYCVLARKWRNEVINEAVSKKKEEKLVQFSKPPEQQPPIKKTSIVHKYEEDESDTEPIVKNIKATAFQAQQVIKNVTAVQDVKNDDVQEDVDYEEEEDIEEDEDIEDEVAKSPMVGKTDAPVEQVEEGEDIEYEEEVDDEELIDEEEEEEVIEEEEEEDISEELDDSELMKKLEAKYGKLPELDDEAEGHSDDEKPVVPARKRPKPTGGNSVGDDNIDNWSEDSNNDWTLQLDLAQAEMDEGNLDDAFRRFTALSLTNPSCWRAKLGRAKALDRLAESKRNNNLLNHAIAAYREVLNMTINDVTFVNVAERVIDRARFRGKHMEAVEVHEMLIKKIPSQPKFRNQLAITYLMVNKVDRARKVLKEILSIWPNDGVALVHHGFILKTIENNLQESVVYLQRGIDSGEDGTMEGRFLFHLGDALARLRRQNEADKIYQLGADKKVFLSPQQRSLYNVDRLTGRPWWRPDQTPYVKLIKELEANWQKIAKEATEIQSHFKLEQENLKDTGHWSQYELFVRGVEIKSHCVKCPITCQIVRSEAAARGCRRGQIKFSAMTPGTHVFAHTGPTNCRLRAHLGLQGTDNTYIRVDKETRSWEVGKVFIFDDSFEHEVWHNGTTFRIVLIVDLWHPELTKEERLQLPAI
ncbi:aspartyl beta-hydroxylase isoform X2 [Arctopsyche grandis]|uniref:aspartyl beta-hydroxylase isoform X2 n=1 Tax=Arctopsyche grandis TaxID=121162 RepID=UPI00406D96B4